MKRYFVGVHLLQFVTHQRFPQFVFSLLLSPLLMQTICSSPPLLRRLYLILQENNIPSSASAVAAASSSSSLSSYAHEQFVDAPPELREFANAPPPALALGGAGVVGHRHGGGRRPAASMRRHQRRRDGAGTTAHLGNVEQHEHHDDGHDGILNGLKSAPVSSTPARDDASEWQSTSLPMHTSSRPSTLSRSQSSRRHRSRNRDRSPDVPPFSNRATRSSSRHRHHGGGGGDPSSSPGGGVVPPRPNLPRHSRSVSRTFSRNGTTSSGPRASYHSFLDFSATLKSEMLFLADSLTHERQSASEAEQCIVQLMNLVINYQTQILENQNVRLLCVCFLSYSVLLLPMRRHIGGDVIRYVMLLRVACVFRCCCCCVSWFDVEICVEKCEESY